MTFQITTGEDNILTHDSYLRIGVRIELKNLKAATYYYMMNGMWYSQDKTSGVITALCNAPLHALTMLD